MPRLIANPMAADLWPCERDCSVLATCDL